MKGRGIVVCLLTATWFLLYVEVLSDAHCRSRKPTDLDHSNCDAHCATVWGKDPVHNAPWAHGQCNKDRCVCKYNEKAAGILSDPTWCKNSPWGSFAEKEIQAVSSRHDPRRKFEQFKKTYGKMYASKSEEMKRLEIFTDNLNIIKELNTNRQDTAVFGITKFADLTREEFSRLIRTGDHPTAYHRKIKTRDPIKPEQLKPPKKSQRRQNSQSLKPRMLNKSNSNSWFGKKSKSNKETTGKAPVAKTSGKHSSAGGLKDDDNDSSRSSQSNRSSRSNSSSRRTYGMDPGGGSGGGPPRFVGPNPSGSPIKDWRVPSRLYPPIEEQWVGNNYCGSCWAFACVPAAEILWARQEDSVTMFSKQDLIDCVGENNGCIDGSIHQGLRWMKAYGTALASDYPFTGITGACQYDVPAYMKINDWRALHQENVWAQDYVMERALSTSPLPLGLPRFSLAFQHYVGGVVAANCDGPEGHAVVIVGHYRDAWIIRNSWGDDWGVDGHFLVRKGSCCVGYDVYRIDGPLENIFHSEPSSSSSSSDYGGDGGMPDFSGLSLN